MNGKRDFLSRTMHLCRYLKPSGNELLILNRQNFSQVKSQSNVHDNESTCIGRENIKSTNIDTSKISPRSFMDIPGPMSIPVFGTLWSYVPLIGEYSFKNLANNALLRYKKYGPLVREAILPGVNLLHVYDPYDIEIVLRAAGKYPERRSHIALQKYRKEKPDIYKSGGLLPTNGEEWWKIRSLFQKTLSSPREAKAFIGITDCVVADFIERIRNDQFIESNDVKVISDFLPFLSRLNLQLICIIAFDVRINSFTPEELLPTSLSSRLIDATYVSNKNTVKTDNMPDIFQNFKTPAYRQLCTAQNFIEQVAVDFVSQKMTFYSDNIHKEDDKDREPSLLESYLSNPEIDLKDIVGMSVDFLLAGIDTTSFTTSFALYHLATNREAQDKLFKEALQLLPNLDDTVTDQIISKAFYLKACLKESLRLNPISIGIGRLIKEDIVLSGYSVPKGTFAVTNNQISCSMPKYFDNSTKYIPERWIREHELFQSYHPFLTIPFGHGSRTCIARRLAEQNMHITLLKLVRNFDIRWKGEKLGVVCELINKPDCPIRLEFQRRST